MEVDTGAAPSEWVPEDDEESEEEEGLTTLEKLGTTSPIAIGGPPVTFEFKPWRLKEEKHIGGLKTRFANNLGAFVREVLNFMLASWNGQEWEQIEKNKRMLLLNQNVFGNVFYQYVYLRYDALGEELRMQDMQCSNCAAPIKNYIADLRTLEVACRPAEHAPEFDYNLRKPVRIGEVMVEKVMLRYTPWDVLEKVKTGTRNEGTLKDHMIAGSIVGCAGAETGKMQLDPNLVKNNLVKKDIEGIYAAVDKHNGGPILALEIECKECGYKADARLNWQYDYFFGNSSLPAS